MSVTDILDFTAGSGAAAAAALHCGARYHGVCVNADQKKWLDSLMDRVIYAVACENADSAAAVGATPEQVFAIKTWYQGTIKEAKRFLIAQGADVAVAEEDNDEGESEGESEESN